MNVKFHFQVLMKENQVFTIKVSLYAFKAKLNGWQ